jgi:hypothetical protein
MTEIKDRFEKSEPPVLIGTYTGGGKPVYVPNKPGELGPGFFKDRPLSIMNRIKEEKTAQDNPLDVQVGGDHYKDFEIQPIVFCMKNKLNACQSNVIKYVCRYNLKDGKKDLEKAKHYIELLIRMEFENEKGTNL